MADTFSTLDTGEYIPVPKVPKSGQLSMQDVLGVREPFLPKRKALESQLSQADLALGEAQQKQKDVEAQGVSAATKKEAEDVRTAQDVYQQSLEANPTPAFIPDKESAKDIAGLFSMVSVLGMLLGGGGKLNAMQAMSAMNGMLEGHQKGRADLYKKQATEFDKNFKAMTKKHEELRKKMEDAVKLASVDKEAGMAAAKMAAVEAGSPIIKTMVDRGEIVRALETLNNSVQGREAALKLVLTEQDRAATRKAAADREAAAERRHREDIASREKLAGQKLGGGAGPSGLVEEFIGERLPAKQAEPIIQSAAAIGQANRIKEMVRADPGIVGREGQVRQFVNKYIDSALSNQELPKDSESNLDQKALRFAKEYASYLVNYERSLAPGSRGFTVFFQKRFNDLMQQNQFNAGGMIGLLDDQIGEVASQATRISKKANVKNLSALGADITGRSQSEAAPAPAATPASSETFSDAEKERRYQEWLKRNQK
jgi:hypothetical protein